MPVLLLKKATNSQVQTHKKHTGLSKTWIAKVNMWYIWALASDAKANMWVKPLESSARGTAATNKRSRGSMVAWVTTMGGRGAAPIRMYLYKLLNKLNWAMMWCWEDGNYIGRISFDALSKMGAMPTVSERNIENPAINRKPCSVSSLLQHTTASLYSWEFKNQSLGLNKQYVVYYYFHISFLYWTLFFYANFLLLFVESLSW